MLYREDSAELVYHLAVDRMNFQLVERGGIRQVYSASEPRKEGKFQRQGIQNDLSERFSEGCSAGSGGIKCLA
ncbi:MAG: hypothetical protein N2253_06975 [Bacteroidia bacterium]|nr:hypothetical protein [Bacteroidia bacterium]MCX7764615.1 hypothetical protein [Bacteroidia bacterium]MDW8057419.1 hypothetical protein [Bacteroidia bacterium]